MCSPRWLNQLSLLATAFSATCDLLNINCSVRKSRDDVLLFASSAMIFLTGRWARWAIPLLLQNFHSTQRPNNRAVEGQRYSGQPLDITGHRFDSQSRESNDARVSQNHFAAPLKKIRSEAMKDDCPQALGWTTMLALLIMLTLLKMVFLPIMLALLVMVALLIIVAPLTRLALLMMNHMSTLLDLLKLISNSVRHMSIKIYLKEPQTHLCCRTK